MGQMMPPIMLLFCFRSESSVGERSINVRYRPIPTPQGMQLVWITQSNCSKHRIWITIWARGVVLTSYWLITQQHKVITIWQWMSWIDKRIIPNRFFRRCVNSRRKIDACRTINNDRHICIWFCSNMSGAGTGWHDSCVDLCKIKQQNKMST